VGRIGLGGERGITRPAGAWRGPEGGLGHRGRGGRASSGRGRRVGGGSYSWPGVWPGATGVAAWPLGCLGKGFCARGSGVILTGSEGRREPGGSWVDLGGGADDSQACQTTFVRQEELQWGEAGFHSQDGCRGARKAIRGPPLDLVPEGRKFPCHVNCGFKGVRAVAEDREKE